MKKLSLREVQLEELELLKYFIDICNKNSIHFFVSDGTTLGAIRHKGFIPWDDDIDVSLPMPEYEKLYKILKSSNNENEKYEFVSYELGNSIYPYLKLINKKISIKENAGRDSYLWIDIFPLVGVSNNKKVAKKLLNRMYILEQLYNVKTTKICNIFKSSKNIKRRFIKLLIKPLSIFINKKQLVKKIIDYSKKYDYDESKYVSNALCLNYKKSIFIKNYFDEEIQIKFEDINVPCCKAFHEYLTELYGNYMRLPKDNERYTHNFDAFYVD